VFVVVAFVAFVVVVVVVVFVAFVVVVVVVFVVDVGVGAGTDDAVTVVVGVIVGVVVCVGVKDTLRPLPNAKDSPLPSNSLRGRYMEKTPTEEGEGFVKTVSFEAGTRSCWTLVNGDSVVGVVQEETLPHPILEQRSINDHNAQRRSLLVSTPIGTPRLQLKFLPAGHRCRRTRGLEWWRRAGQPSESGGHSCLE